MNIRFTEPQWQTAQNLKQMLREGKTFLEIKSGPSIDDSKFDRIKTIVENFVKEVSISEIYHHIIDMEPVDQQDYTKIVNSLIKRFSNSYIIVKLTLPEKTIEKFHQDYIPEGKSTGLWIIAACVTILTAGIGLWYYFNYMK